MSFFGKLFGRESVPSLPPELVPPSSSPAPPGAPAVMTLRDAKGRQVQIGREEWRTKVLPVNFFKAWQDPDELANLIESALTDGFLADCIEPVKQLVKIDARPRRSATFYGVVLIQNGKFDEAAKVILEALRQHGDDAVTLTNLAKAQAGQGDMLLAERTLWRALELDPNYEFAFSWYETLYKERGGDAAGVEALRRVAALPGAWSPQLALALAALQTRQIDRAMAYYEESLARAPRQVPSDLLQQMTGSLGQQGYLKELIQIAEPYFVPAVHGPVIGNNLIKAHLDLGQTAAARAVLDQLHAHEQPGWREHLNYWDAAVAKAGHRG